MATDLLWSYVELLLHCDGADGSTTFTDSSGSGHTVTANGNAQIDTGRAKFGGASALFDGTGDYLSIPDSADWAFGTGDFTIECWCFLTSTTYAPIYAQIASFSSDDNRIMVGYWGGNWNLFARSTSTTVDLTVADTPPTSTWFHFALTRSGSNLRFFRDGTQIGGTLSDSDAIPDLAASAYIGTGRISSAQRYLSGSIDDIRVSKGIARYTANFTAPAAAFSDGPGSETPSTQANQGGTGLIPGYFVAATSTEAHQSSGAALTAVQTIVPASASEKHQSSTGILGLTFALPISIENYYRVHAGLPITFRVLSTPTLPTLGITVGAYAVTATLPVVFRLRSTPTLPTLPVVIYGNASASAGTDEAVTWKPKCVIDGTDVSAILIGAGEVEFDEMAAPVASFSLLPAAGTVDPLAYVGKRVTLAIQTLVAGVVAGEYLVFTGTISDPVWSVDDRVLTITATSDMQSVFDSMTKADIDTQLASVSPQYSEIVFGDPADLSGYEYAEALISTANAVLWQDAGGIIRVNSTLPKVSADYTVEDDARFIGADLSYPARMDMINKREIAIEYRFQRKRSREVKVSFRPWQLITPEVWLSCEGGWDLPQRDQIESAASGSGWYPTDDISYVEVWPNGLYGTRGCSGVNFQAGMSISDDIRDTLCVGANWTAARRWLQTVTETASIVVGASESQAVVGVLADAESYGYESEYSDETWEDSLEEAEYSTSGMTQMASGDWKLDLDTDRSDFETAQEVAIAKARADILKSHRGTTLTFQTVFRPEIDLSHTIHVDCAWVEAQGKVRRVTHRWDQDTGSCTSDIAIALYRHNGAGLVTDTPVAATEKAADPDETAPDTILKLPMYIGGRDDCEPYDPTWTGYIVNMAPYESASTDPVDRAEVWSRSPLNPAVQRYEPEGFHMIYPTIDSSYADPTNAAATATFDVAIPEDLLVLTA